MPKANAGRGAAWNSSLSDGKQRNGEPGLLMGRRRLQGEQSTVKVLLSLSHNIWMFSVRLPKTNIPPLNGSCFFLVERTSMLNQVGVEGQSIPALTPGADSWLKVTTKSTGVPWLQSMLCKEPDPCL